MAVLEPEFAILDETDSGLDIDALRIVAEGVNAQLSPDLGVLLITHYQRLLNYIKPDVVHVLAARPDRQDRRQGPRPAARGGGLRPDPARGRPTSRPARRGAHVPEPEPTLEPGRPLAATPMTHDRPTAVATPSPLDPVALRRRLPASSSATSAAAALAYLDCAATCLKPRVVLDAVDGYYRATRQRPSRHLHHRRGGHRRLRGARATSVARFINAPTAREIVFVRNATEAINLVAYAWGRRNIGRGDTIVLTELEHHANLVPWQLLAQEKDARPGVRAHRRRGPAASRTCFEVLLRTQAQAGRVHPRLERARHDQPGREMVGKAHAAGRPGARRRRPGGAAPAGRRPGARAPTSTSSPATRCSAPTGLRRALGARELLEAMPPFMGGGEMIREVHLRRTDVQRRPLEVRGGHAGHRRRAIGLGAAARLPRGHRAWTPSARTSASSSRTRSRCCRARCRASRIYGPLDRRRARRHRHLQPAGRPPARRGHAPRPRGDRHPGRPPLHAAAPRAARRGGHRARQLQRLHRPRRHRPPGGRPAPRSSASSRDPTAVAPVG